jgi:hypothetical protein
MLRSSNAAPEAEAVYGTLGTPFAELVGGLRQCFSSGKKCSEFAATVSELLRPFV